MIEKKTETTWNILSSDGEGNLAGRVALVNSGIRVFVDGLDTFEEFVEFHQALGEAIEEAEK